MRHDDEVMEWVTSLQMLTPTSHVSRPTIIIELAFHNEMSSYLLSYSGLRISCRNGTRL